MKEVLKKSILEATKEYPVIIGIKTKATKNGGTFARRDIALEFASWISLEIKLYISKWYNACGKSLLKVR